MFIIQDEEGQLLPESYKSFLTVHNFQSILKRVAR